MKRVISNYLRLATTFAVGVLVIRMMAEIGHSALVLYLLLAAGTGIAQLLKIVLRESVIPVLGLTFDGKSGRDFAEVYWAAILLGGAAGLFGLLFFAMIWVFRDAFDFGALGALAVGAAIGSCAVQAFASSVSTPFLNAVLIDHRIVAYNLVLVLERVAELIAATVALLLPAEYGVEDRVAAFYAITGACYVLVQIGVYRYASRCNPRFRARRTRLRRADLGWICGILGWNAALVLGFALYARLAPFVVNAGLGEGATLTLGLVLALIGYQRQIAMGLVIGLDAAISRHYGRGAATDRHDARELALRSTYLQAVFAAFSVAALWLFIEPVLRLWLGRSLDGSAWDLGLSILLFKIMSVGILSRSISEGWMKFLSGKGEIRAYAPMVLAGGVVFAIVALAAARQDSVTQGLIAIAIAFSALTCLVHAGYMAIATARRLEVRPSALYGLVAIPIAIAALAAVVSAVISGGSMDVQNALSVSVILCLAGIGALLAMRPAMARLVPRPCP